MTIRSLSRANSTMRANMRRARGWTVADNYVFVDDGISGAEFTSRPGFLWLMNTLTPRAAFQVLINVGNSSFGR